MVRAAGKHEGFGADTVDIMFISSHASTMNSDYFSVVLKDTSLWKSDTGRFGDDSRGLKLFVIWTCSNMGNGDGYRIARWDSIFKGGLKMAVGFISPAYPSDPDVGYNFANNLHDGYTIKYAWHLATNPVHAHHIPGYIVTGTNCTDAATRSSMEYTEFESSSFPALQDGNIGCYRVSTYG